MKLLKQPDSTEDFSGAWCNANAVTSSVMEAVSLITPVLEKFFIRTVADALPDQRELALVERCREFIREESNHSRVHLKFNAALLHYLGDLPPGLALVEALLTRARRHLSLANQLLLASALEHLAAVLSTVYLRQEAGLRMNSDFAKALFSFHAHEEIAHCSVVFDLWRSHHQAGNVGRTLTILAIILMGALYIGLSVPWILYRKSGKRFWKTVALLLKFATRNSPGLKHYSPLAEMFSFIRGSYHPDHLFKVGAGLPVGSR